MEPSVTEETNEESAATDGKEVLIVMSKLKKYIRERSGMNTSGSVASALSERVRALSDQAIEKAKSEGRKTVMDRDFDTPPPPIAG